MKRVNANRKKLKKSIENNLAIWFFSTFLAGFVGGVGVHKAILAIGHHKEALEEESARNPKNPEYTLWYRNFNTSLRPLTTFSLPQSSSFSAHRGTFTSKRNYLKKLEDLKLETESRLDEMKQILIVLVHSTPTDKDYPDAMELTADIRELFSSLQKAIRERAIEAGVAMWKR